MDRNKSPAHILMSHGGKQHNSNPHNVFKTKRKAYSTGGYATGGDTYDTGGETKHRGRRPVNINSQTGHPQYFLSFVLPALAGFGLGKLHNKILGKIRKPQPVPQAQPTPQIQVTPEEQPQPQRRGGRSRARYATGRSAY